FIFFYFMPSYYLFVYIWNKFLALVYNINENHSAYASYTDIFKPQNFKDANDNLLDPIVGRNYEVGVKGDYFDKRLNAGITLFRMSKIMLLNILEIKILLPEIVYMKQKMVLFQKELK
ncbi:TonB-dependent receptor, partial [Arcobacter lanthieri]|uniref:TonB-dependent receptor domain-containing protein n=1 Tax=Aliarcobacter lanthieri TaxID=1355374 RepID=UPI0019236892